MIDRMKIYAPFLSMGLLLACAAHAASPAAKCEAKKLKLTGKYSFCRLKAEATAAKTGSPDGLPAALEKCDSGLATKWAAAEARGGADCPTMGDVGAVQVFTGAFTHFAVLQADGRRFIDNGDGTITDTRTHLMWEKKDGDDGPGGVGTPNYSDPHDVDNTYSWSISDVRPDGTAFTQFLGALNTCSAAMGNDGFAGHCDWRLPTASELGELFFQPISEVGMPCNFFVEACTFQEFWPTAFSSTDTGPYYWTAISSDPTHAVAIGFDYHHCTNCSVPKSTPNWVRAVRDGFGPLAVP